MTQRKNFQLLLDGKIPEFRPIYYELYKTCGLADSLVNHPKKNGPDAFGVEWVITPEGAITKPGCILFDDIADWKQYVHFPDLSMYDFKAAAETDLAGTDRSDKVINVNFAVGLYQRMVAFMGFENTLCSLIEDPEACDEFFGEMADFNIRCIEKMIDAYIPDVVTYFDDFATSQSLFMSPQVYRKLIKPHQARILHSISAKGVIVAEHLCGKCEEVLDDFVEMGVQIWSSAQVMNDIPFLEKKYKGRLIIEGGWDSFGPAGYPDATTEQILKEADRCLSEYGKEYNYILFPIIVTPDPNDPRISALCEYWRKISGISSPGTR